MRFIVTKTDTPADTSRRRREISAKVTVIARQMRKQFDQHLEGLGVTRSLWMVIAMVSRQPGVSQRAIAELLEMSEAGAGRLIDRLCADGLLLRLPKDDDRRAYRIQLTEAARPILEKVSAIAVQREEKIFAGIDDGDLKKLETLLAAIYRNINP